MNFLSSKSGSKKSKDERIKKIQAYIEKYLPEELSYEEIKKRCPSEIHKYEMLKDEIFALMKQADSVATTVRAKMKYYGEN